jgi:hypothetical protein
MQIYTQVEWATLRQQGRAVLLTNTGKDPAEVIVDGKAGRAFNPDSETATTYGDDAVVFVED